MSLEPAPARTSIQTQADYLVLLINEEVNKAVAATRKQVLLELRGRMKSIVDAAYKAGKANSGSIYVGNNENGRIHPEGEVAALGQQLFTDKGPVSTNIIANGEEARASQQLARLHASLREFGISVSDGSGCLRFETTSGWNTVLVNLGITNVTSLRELLETLTKRVHTDRQHINDLRNQVHLRDQMIRELTNRINILQDQPQDMCLTSTSMKISSMTNSISIPAAMNQQLPIEPADLAVQNLPMDIYGLSENPSGPVPSPAWKHPADGQTSPMG